MLIILMATIKYVDTISYCAICDISQSRMQSNVKGLGLSTKLRLAKFTRN